MAGGHAQVCHTHYAVGDNRHTLHPIRIPGRAPDEGAKTVVNLFGNLIDARDHTLKQIFRPAFERFAHHCVVGIGKRVGYDPPGIIPAVAALIKQNTHQLGDCHSGVRIVDMNRYLIRKIIK